MASTDGLDQVEGELAPRLHYSFNVNPPTEQLKAVIDNLYMLICQAHEFRGSQTTEAMTFEM
jgi:mediator of RNA polymerase II transcription subunit 10